MHLSLCPSITRFSPLALYYIASSLTSSWCDAAYRCGTPCPTQSECAEGEYCYANLPCSSSRSPPPLTENPSSATTQFCGLSLDNAKDTCWQPCPRGDSDCCLGMTCYDTAESSSTSSEGQCSTSDYSGSNNFYCGKSWCDAAYTCGTACVGGTDEECASGEYCYADVPCMSRPVPEMFPPTSGYVPTVTPPSNSYTYCGVSAGDATERCWQECSVDSDCCFGQSCEYYASLELGRGDVWNAVHLTRNRCPSPFVNRCKQALIQDLVVGQHSTMDQIILIVELHVVVSRYCIGDSTSSYLVQYTLSFSHQCLTTPTLIPILFYTNTQSTTQKMQ